MVAEIGITPGSPSWLRLARLAKVLAALTLVWLGIEGAIGVVAGVLAGSIALVAFGLDSAIEGLASVIVIWRFTGNRTLSAEAERRAQKWVAVSFFLLAPYEQPQRERALAHFREGRARVLVATDIAARGIDVDRVSHVINFDLPNVPEDYVHRVGRTARAGATGIAIAFC